MYRLGFRLRIVTLWFPYSPLRNTVLSPAVSLSESGNFESNRQSPIVFLGLRPVHPLRLDTNHRHTRQD
jgi:hypothetical protein